MEELENIQTKIIEAFSSDGCPLCVMLQRDEFDRLCFWIAESVKTAQNSQQIKLLIEYGGFCNEHFWRLQKVSTPYGIANIGMQLVEDFLQIMKTKGQNCAVVNTLKNRCPLCFELDEKQKMYLEELAVMLKNDAHKAGFQKSRGLCIPHYIRILKYINDESLVRFLYETEVKQLEKVKNDAAGFIAKREPPLKWQQTQDEKMSWFRAIEMMAGRVS